MKIFDKYLAKTVFTMIFIVLLVLVGLFTFFAFIDEIDDIGKQRYGIWQAIQYVLLEIPRHVYDLFPVSALLGSLLGLGILANQGELTVLRAAGVSITRIAFAILKVGLVLLLLVMLIGEFLAPYSGQYAKDMRAIAQSEHQQQQMVFSSHYGFWARDERDFINIRTIFPDGRFGHITLYQFDRHWRLKTLIRARTATYKNQHWLLDHVEVNTIKPTTIQRQRLAHITWEAMLNPELVKIVVVQPDQLSSFGLYQYIQYLQQSGQRYARYQLAFWIRLSYPLTSITMIFIAIPFVFGQLRSIAIGQRLLVGALLGISFHMLTQILGHMGLVYNINPILTAFLPPILFLGLALILMRRAI